MCEFRSIKVQDLMDKFESSMVGRLDTYLTGETPKVGDKVILIKDSSELDGVYPIGTECVIIGVAIRHTVMVRFSVDGNEYRNSVYADRFAIIKEGL